MNSSTNESLWRNPGFARLFGAHTISLLGAALTSVALGLLAYELVGAAVSQVLGVTLTIRIVVIVLLSPFAGAVAGWLGSKATLIGADLFRAGVVIGFFLCQTVWQIYFLAFLMNVASALFTPVYKAAIPNIVSTKQYPKAVSLGSIAYEVANILGPTLAGFFILWFGFRGNFLVHTAAFLVSAALILPVRLAGPTPAAGAAAPAPGRLSGMRALIRRPALLCTLFLSFRVSIASGFVLVATIDYVKNELLLPDSFYAWALAAASVGAVAGALAYGQIENQQIRQRLYAVLPWGILTGLLLVAFTRDFSWLMVAWFLAGSGQTVLMIRGNELLAAHSTPFERPSIYAAHFSLSHLGWGLTYPLAGWTTTVLQFNRAALLFAILFALATLAQALYFRVKVD
jgi:MFS transporter, NRE family, putaive nickel resistance protein